MSVSASQIARVAQRVANQVRKQVPRSSNRFLEDGTTTTGTDWLHDESKIEYTKFLQTVARIQSEGNTQSGIRVLKSDLACKFTKSTTKSAKISHLKKDVIKFVREGRVDGKPVDLRYKSTLGDEAEYSRKFGVALADYLNNLGYRKGKEQKKFEGRRVMWDISLELAIFDRGMLARSAPSLPLTYIRSSALNAATFGVGNCEECGCAAFATLLTLTSIDNISIIEDRIRVELIYAKTKSDAHFFVLLNRAGALDVMADFDTWTSDPSVVVCDPWIVDRGLGDVITSNSEDVRGLREWMKPNVGFGLEILTTRATGFMGRNDGLKPHDNFILAKAL